MMTQYLNFEEFGESKISILILLTFNWLTQM